MCMLWVKEEKCRWICIIWCVWVCVYVCIWGWCWVVFSVTANPHCTISVTCIGTVCIHVEVRGMTSQLVLSFHHVHFKDCTHDLRLANGYPSVLIHAAGPSTSLLFIYFFWLGLSLKLGHVFRHCVWPACSRDPPVSASPGHFCDHILWGCELLISGSHACTFAPGPQN